MTKADELLLHAPAQFERLRTQFDAEVRIVLQESPNSIAAMSLLGSDH